jgi:plastocyanin
MRRLGLICLAVLAGVAISACSGPTASTGAATPPAEASEPVGSTALVCAKAGVGDAGATVDIKDFKFNPDPVTAKVGDMIAWTNSDGVPHTASLSDGTCSTDQLATGITGALVFGVAGTYTYQCNVHPSQMKGFTITITE